MREDRQHQTRGGDTFKTSASFFKLMRSGYRDCRRMGRGSQVQEPQHASKGRTASLGGDTTGSITSSTAQNSSPPAASDAASS